jgi:hypothetical protein
VTHAAHVISLINWQAPWLAPWRALGQRASALIAQGHSVHQALNAQASSGTPVEFTSQDILPEGTAYEQFIYVQRRVPTRDNLHDFFNGLAWLLFPQTKSRLNELQHSEIRSRGVQATRGAVRDALTLFDENAAIVHLPDAVIRALRARDWHTALVTHRQAWIDSPPVLFGHALIEKLVSPYKSITAHVWVLPDAEAHTLDMRLARSLHPHTLVPKPFVPLPVLGVPLWSPDNADPGFYRDTEVFRPPRAMGVAAN